MYLVPRPLNRHHWRSLISLTSPGVATQFAPLKLCVFEDEVLFSPSIDFPTVTCSSKMPMTWGSLTLKHRKMKVFVLKLREGSSLIPYCMFRSDLHIPLPLQALAYLGTSMTKHEATSMPQATRNIDATCFRNPTSEFKDTKKPFQVLKDSRSS